MSEQARALALKIFDIIAEAEGKAHAVAKEDVHFHEVGAIDSIVDIVAIAVCFDSLGVYEVIVPELCEGRGTVRCQHGVLPVPVPATANIMQRFGFNVRLLPVQGEFVTPTGAAAAAALMTTDELPQSFVLRQLFLLIAYSLSPLRNRRRVRLTLSKSSGRVWSLLSNSTVTSATPKALRLPLPEKITSSILLPRRYFALCSPNTQRMASEILLLPEPFGPTTAVIPLSKFNSILSAKDLKP